MTDSVFENNTPATPDTDDNALNNGQQSDPLSELVGEGKKFKTVEDLAKGKTEADAYIEQLKQELAEMREDLNKRAGLEDVLDSVKAAQSTSQEPTKTPEIDESMLDKLVEQKITAIESQRTAQENEAAANAKMVEHYGDVEKAKAAFTAKAAELNMDPASLRSMAQQSPKAFMTLMGVSAKEHTPAKTQGTVRTDALPNVSGGPREGTFAWYQQLRRENPRKYYQPAIQNRMFEDRKRLGEDFYK